LLNTTALFARVRNVQLRLVQPGTLRQVDVFKYDERMVLEAIHNAVAHQDYGRAGRVLVQEFADRLVITNEGGFFDGVPDEYAAGLRSPIRYRNQTLAQVMAEFGMIDTMGFGILDMYTRQMRRFLPMPDYDLTKPDQVKLTIYGTVVDEAYTRLLMQRADLSLADVLALDRVQKSLPIPQETAKYLRRKTLIEGRLPRLRVASVAVEVINAQAARIRARGQDDLHYLQLIVDYLTQFSSATRADIDTLLRGKLVDSLSEEDKTRKVANLLSKLRRDGHITNTGTRANPVWTLTASAS
jgi:ATP-dependent DNA helicase RecG